MKTTQYKEDLLKEKELLEGELQGIAIFNTDTNKWEATPDASMIGEIDENDAADRFEDFEERTSMVQTLQERLTDINDALELVGKDTYGMCLVGEPHPIEEDRLAANPAARTCKLHMNG